MSTAAERAAQLDLVARLKSAYPELPDAPTPDLLDHDRITAYLKPVHDVGGEPDAPMKYENKQYELWEHMTYVICEVLGWRGIWLSEERRRMGNVDVGRAEYLGLPYYGRWLLAVARILVEKHHIGLTELSERMAEVKSRYAGGLDGKKFEAKPKFEGDGSQVKRNEHHMHAVGKGDPQVYAGQAGHAEVQGRRRGGGARAAGDLLHPHPGVCARRDRRNRGGRLRKPGRRGRDLGPSRDTGVVLRRSVQHVRAVARLHRNRRRRPRKPRFPNTGCKPPNKLPRKEFA